MLFVNPKVCVPYQSSAEVRVTPEVVTIPVFCWTKFTFLVVLNSKSLPSLYETFVTVPAVDTLETTLTVNELFPLLESVVTPVIMPFR